MEKRAVSFLIMYYNLACLTPTDHPHSHHNSFLLDYLFPAYHYQLWQARSREDVRGGLVVRGVAWSTG